MPQFPHLQIGETYGIYLKELVSGTQQKLPKCFLLIVAINKVYQSPGTCPHKDVIQLLSTNCFEIYRCKFPYKPHNILVGIARQPCL